MKKLVWVLILLNAVGGGVGCAGESQIKDWDENEWGEVNKRTPNVVTAGWSSTMESDVKSVRIGEFVWISHHFNGKVFDVALARDIVRYLDKKQESGFEVVMTPSGSNRWLYKRTK